jgi:hypothetical protein
MLGFEMGRNYFKTDSKTMVETDNTLMATGLIYGTGRASG